MTEGTQLPQANESERIVLGSIIADGERIKQVAHILTKEDFYDKKLATIYRAMSAMFKQRKEIDLITLSDFLQQKDYLESIGGSATIVDLTNYVDERNASIVAHAKIVADRGVARRIIYAANKIIEKADKVDDMDEFTQEAEQILKGVTRTSARIQDKLAIVDLAEWRQTARDTDPINGARRGLSMGYKSLDDLTEGFEPGELIVLTGHTKHGKSKLAANIAWNVAMNGHNVLFVNTEMTKIQVARRMNGMQRIDDIKGKIYINDRADLEYQDVTTMMEKAKELGVDMVVIDHLHFFSRSEDNQANQISKITKEFKEAAVNLELPVMLLAHVSQGDTSKVPKVKDLKGSSAIAQDADMVITVWRDDRPNAPDPHTTKVVRLIARSAQRAVTQIYLYADGIRLLENKPDTNDQQRQYAEDQSRMLGEGDDGEIDLESGWDEESRSDG